MKTSWVVWMSVSLLTAGAHAQAPSPAPAPEQGDSGPRPEMRQRPSPGGERQLGPMGGEGGSGMERIVGAIAAGPEMAKRLNLTTNQHEQIKKMVMEQRTKMIDQGAALQKAALKQTEVLMAEPLDEKALMEAVEETSKVRSEMAKQQIQILIEVRKILTEEQRKALRELMVKMRQPPGERGNREGMRGRGPQGPRGPQAPQGVQAPPAPAGGDVPPPPPAPAP